MRFERSRAACTRCCFAEPAGRGTCPGTAGASMLKAALDECRSWLSFVDRTAREDASSDDRREPGWLISRTSKAAFIVRPATGWTAGREQRFWSAAARQDRYACRVASNQRAVFAAHVPFQLVNGCRSRGRGDEGFFNHPRVVFANRGRPNFYRDLSLNSPTQPGGFFYEAGSAPFWLSRKRPD
jgi:hypothetical protein